MCLWMCMLVCGQYMPTGCDKYFNFPSCLWLSSVWCDTLPDPKLSTLKRWAIYWSALAQLMYIFESHHSGRINLSKQFSLAIIETHLSVWRKLKLPYRISANDVYSANYSTPHTVLLQTVSRTKISFLLELETQLSIWRKLKLQLCILQMTFMQGKLLHSSRPYCCKIRLRLEI